MVFEPVVHIDLEALRHNLRVARRAAPRSRLMAVVKADAYGHGLLRVVEALGEADSLAVARVGEGLALRNAGVSKPVTVLGGFLDEEELGAAAAAGLTLVVHQPAQLHLLKNTPLSQPVSCWLKVDTGMNRLGFAPEAAAQAYRELKSLAAVHGAPGLMTHLANADQRTDPASSAQLQRFQPLLDELGAVSSIANSAAVLAWPESHGDWIRPGLMLYGASPFPDAAAKDLELQPVMSFCARLIAVKQLRKGDRVGYGGIWQAREDMPLGVVGAGYGDGYPRELAAGTPVLLGNRRAPLVGRVSMDMCTVDLRGIPDAMVGDPVTLWGRGLPVEEIARAAGTVPYTLLCGITSRVLHRAAATDG